MKLILENWRHFIREQAGPSVPFEGEGEAESESFTVDQLSAGESPLQRDWLIQRDKKKPKLPPGPPREEIQRRIRKNIGIVIEVAKKYNIPPERLVAIAWKESGFNPLAGKKRIGQKKYDFGMMQIRNTTFKDYITDRSQKPYIDKDWPELNKKLLQHFDDSPASVRGVVEAAAQVYRGAWRYFDRAHGIFLNKAFKGHPRALQQKKNGTYINPISGASPLPPSHFIVTASYVLGAPDLRKVINKNPFTWEKKFGGKPAQYARDVQKIIDSGMFKDFLEFFASSTEEPVEVDKFEATDYVKP
jgi:hypothetical protein